MSEKTKCTALLVSDVGGVRTITLNRPDRLNAIDLAMTHELEAAVGEAQRDDTLRVIVLRGAGRAFCAGDDLLAQEEILTNGEAALRDQLASLQNISRMLVLGRKPSIAAVKGWAIGAGLSWVLNCDHVVWAEGAKGFFPELSFGTFVTGGASWLLPVLAGKRRAADILFRATRLSAEDAYNFNIASQIVAADEADAVAADIATTLAASPMASTQALKALWAQYDASQFEKALESETLACIKTTLNPETMGRMRDAIKRS